MNIHGYSGLTLLDYPQKTAAMVYTGGCNMRCLYCHNAVLVEDPASQPLIGEEEVLEKLAKRKGILDGLVITGGEPTLNRDLPDFCRKVKALGFLVKLDTNGTNPEMVSKLIAEGLIDYVAMDIKSAPRIHRYSMVTPIGGVQFSNIEMTKNLLMKQDRIDYEFRTTVVSGIHNDDDFKDIADWCSAAKAYFLQAYRECPGINPEGFHMSTPSSEDLGRYLEILRTRIPGAEIRGQS